MVDPMMLAILELADKILAVASRVFGLRDKFKPDTEKRREAIFDYFLKLSETLSRAANSLENGVVPHGECQAMLTYSQMFSRTIGGAIGGVIDPNLVHEWQNALISAHRLESLSQVSQKDREEVIAKLRGSAGMFEAVAYSLRAAA